MAGSPLNPPGRASRRSARTVPALGPTTPLTHPAVIIAALATAAALVLSVSFMLSDTDMWQHLAVGRAIWTLREVPRTQIWTWPLFGQPDVTLSWGFRALLWPFWDLGGVTGLFVWRWLTTLVAFGVLWAVARLMGARGLTPLVALALCGLAYRQRSQIRPETLVAALLAVQLWLLESRRAAFQQPGGMEAQAGRPGGEPPRLERAALVRDGSLVLVAWVWANVHVSYLLGLTLTAINVLDAWLSRAHARGSAGPGRATPPEPWRHLAWVLAGSVAISFVNPFGWRVLAEPIQYYLTWRHEPMFRAIGELQPLDLRANWRNGLPLLMVGWPVLLLWRWRRIRPDRVGLVVCALFTWLTLGAQRFVGYYAIVAAPYVARDLDAWVRVRAWPTWTAPPWRRAALVVTACVLLGLPEWSRPNWPLGVAYKRFHYPERACDFMAAHGVAGRGFNQFPVGGYLLWRFWPDRTRLPFADIHPEQMSPDDRLLYSWAFSRREVWRTLEGRYDFDYILLYRVQVPGDRLLDFLDADTTFVPVFIDDIAAIYVRREGALRAVADTFAYRVLPAGGASLTALGPRCATDPAFRAAVRHEAERQVAASPFSAAAHNLLANLAEEEGRPLEIRTHLLEVLRQDPQFPHAHARLGFLALAGRRPDEALREFRLERSRGARDANLAVGFGRAHEALNDYPRAARSYRQALSLEPGNPEAQAGLQRTVTRPER